MLSDADVLTFYERASDEVYRYAIRLVGGDRSRAEDLLQDTFLTFVRQVRAGRADGVDIGWAITTCRSRFLDQIRRREVADLTLRRAFERPADDGPGAGALDALGRLGDLHRAALVLRYVDDLPVAEVARLLDRSVHATESLLVRARESLRQAYRAAEGGE